jgi:formylmethanofuran:tetrahydromethanopterin formyltransferase
MSYPGGFVERGLKARSNYKFAKASTYERVCPMAQDKPSAVRRLGSRR